MRVPAANPVYADAVCGRGVAESFCAPYGRKS